MLYKRRRITRHLNDSRDSKHNQRHVGLSFMKSWIYEVKVLSISPTS